MATMPPRINSLEDTVKSIIIQCDRLNIYLNNFGDKPTPSFLINNKINVYRSEQEAGDIGDVGKFYCCDDWSDCYAFTIDDKFIYPPDYVSRMIVTIEKYNRMAVISCHGRTIKPDCSSYYQDPDKAFSITGEVKEDIFSHILGTGCMALHIDTFKFDLSIFTHTNISDILVSMALQKAKIPVIIMKHERRWIQVSNKFNQVYSIHSFCSNHDRFQTDLVNSFNWMSFKL